MLTNITTSNSTGISLTPMELARKRAIESDKAAWALERFLEHTAEEAASIVNDPVYSLRDLSLISIISEMLRNDLLFCINSFYEDETPMEPTCKQICERLVERFPIEPMIMNPFGNHPTVYENAVNISRGLVGRLLRAKAFRITCEDQNFAAREYYRSVALLDTEMNFTSFDDAAVLFTSSIEYLPENFGFQANTIIAPHIIKTEQSNLQEVLFLICVLSAASIITYNMLVCRGNYLRRNLAATIGMFSQPVKVCKSRLEQEKVSELHKPVSSWRKALSKPISLFSNCCKSRPARQPLASEPSSPAPLGYQSP
jgi:hypothetical protein